MISSDYPMTFGYGRTDPPYGTAAYPYHRGDDYAMPEGTPIVVNGVQIGISGHTGFVTGPHCHIGRFINGQDTNPSSQGWTLIAPQVTNITYDNVNGNEVGLVDTAGVRWVYLHMRDLSTDVKVGDYLDKLPKYNEGGDVASQADLDLANYKLSQSEEALRVREQQAADLQKQIDLLNYQFSESEKALRVREAQTADLQQQISDLQTQVNTLKAANGDNSEANLLGQTLIKLLATFGYKKG